MPQPMEQAEYVERVRSGDEARCPFCGAGATANVEYDNVTFDAGRVDQRAYCHACDKVWYDLYELTGYQYPE